MRQLNEGVVNEVLTVAGPLPRIQEKRRGVLSVKPSQGVWFD